MKKTTLMLLPTLLTLACGAPTGDGFGSSRQGLSAAEGDRLVAFVNDASTDFVLLDDDCGIRSDSAANIIARRATTPFTSVADLLTVRMVGEWTVDTLSTCADHTALLAFVNAATFEQLDVDCALHSDSAKKIVQHRDGKDKTPGTSDDDLFDTVLEIDEVKQVGPWTMAMLFGCALDATTPEPPPAPTGPTTETLYDLAQLDPTLVTAINGELFDAAYDNRDTSVYFGVEWSSVDIHREDGVITSYHVNYVQWIDPEGGIQLWISVEIDPNYEIWDVFADI